MKPIDLLHFGPTRTATRRLDGSYIITVTPSIVTGLPPTTIQLTADQYRRFHDDWLMGDKLIQDALPDLSPAQREILMTGIGEEDFHRIASEDEEGDEHAP